MTDLPGTDVLLVPQRFCGPPSSANGGYAAGALAALVARGRDLAPAGLEGHHDRPWPAITVSLRRPPPLDEPMPVTEDDGWSVAMHGPDVVARAQLAAADPVPVEPVPAAVARAARASYPGLVSHPFPTCVGCGTAREEGDGLRVFPGRVEDAPGAPDQVRVAATWTPHPSLAEDWHEYADAARHASVGATWAALDCIGAWAGDLGERAMVLGQMTAQLHRLPLIGEEHVVMGLERSQQGRKTFTASTLYDAAGAVVGAAEHVWISVDPADFG